MKAHVYTDQFELTLNSWRSISTDTRDELSEKAIRALGIIKHLVKTNQIKGYKYFMGIFKRSQDQVRRYFDEIEEAGLCKIIHKKTAEINGKKRRNILEFCLTLQGLKVLRIQAKNTPQSCAAKMRSSYKSNDSIRDKDSEEEPKGYSSSESKKENKEKSNLAAASSFGEPAAKIAEDQDMTETHDDVVNKNIEKDGSEELFYNLHYGNPRLQINNNNLPPIDKKINTYPNSEADLKSNITKLPQNTTSSMIDLNTPKNQQNRGEFQLEVENLPSITRLTLIVNETLQRNESTNSIKPEVTTASSDFFVNPWSNIKQYIIDACHDTVDKWDMRYFLNGFQAVEDTQNKIIILKGKILHIENFKAKEYEPLNKFFDDNSHKLQPRKILRNRYKEFQESFYAVAPHYTFEFHVEKGLDGT